MYTTQYSSCNVGFFHLNQVEASCRNTLMKILDICWESLSKGTIQIEGTVMKHDDDDNGGRVYFHSDTHDDLVIGMNAVEESGLFRISNHGYERVSLEAVHLSIHEFAAAAFLCVKSKNLVNKMTKLFKTNLERALAVFHFMAELTSESNGNHFNKHFCVVYLNVSSFFQ